MAHSTARTRTHQIEQLRKQFAQGDGLAFADVLSTERVERAVAEEKASWREEVWTPLLTLWAFLGQVIGKGADASCRKAVDRVLAWLVARGAHDVHHKGGQAEADSPDGKVLEARDTMLCACLARLMDKLAAVAAKDGTLLDHTVLLMGGAQISSHSGKSFPTLLAGGRKLGFKHGQHVKYEAEKKPMSNLYLTILQQLGCPVTAFKESNGTLSELLV